MNTEKVLLFNQLHFYQKYIDVSTILKNHVFRNKFVCIYLPFSAYVHILYQYKITGKLNGIFNLYMKPPKIIKYVMLFKQNIFLAYLYIFRCNKYNEIILHIS